MAESHKTYVFALEKDSVGPLALGSGPDLASARRDAATRMLARHPFLRRSDGDRIPVQRLLLEKLHNSCGNVVSRFSGGFHSQEELGHEFMSHDTMRMAQSLSSWSQASEFAAKTMKEVGEPGAIGALQKKYQDQCRKEDADPRLVDWAEVLSAIVGDGEDLVEGRSQQENLNLIQDDLGVKPVHRRAIDPDVLEVLKRCTADGNHVRLPEGRLDRKLYERVNEVLMALGGKWVARKVQAHVFAEDPTAVLDVAIGTGTFVKPQDFGYFPTQPREVERVIGLADLRPGQKGFEPSAGQGAIALEMARILGFDNVAVVELLPGNARKLREFGFKTVSQVDFLSVEPAPIYDRIIMNPPFGGMADVAHIQHAARFLNPEGRLVAITSPSWTFHSARKAQDFRDFVAECDGHVEEVAAGAFQAAGTNVATRIVTVDAMNLPWYRESAPTERMRA